MRDLIEQLRELHEGKGLPEDPWKYFKKVSGTVLVPVAKLKTTRARPSGIKHAEQFMRLAYKGEYDRRKPISVKKNDDGTYTVLDGNSTSAIAKKSGWTTIPATLE